MGLMKRKIDPYGPSPFLSALDPVTDGRGFNFPTSNVAMRLSSVHARRRYTLCSSKSPNMQLRAPYPDTEKISARSLIECWLRSSGVDLRADEGSPSRETGFRPACRTVERPRQKQAGQAPSGNRGAARQRVHPKVHREALQFFACQPRKLDEEARNQETEAVKPYGGFCTFEPLGPSCKDGFSGHLSD